MWAIILKLVSYVACFSDMKSSAGVSLDLTISVIRVCQNLHRLIKDRDLHINFDKNYIIAKTDI